MHLTIFQIPEPQMKAEKYETKIKTKSKMTTLTI